MSKAIQRADVVVTVTEAIKEEIESEFHPNDVHVVSPFVDIGLEDSVPSSGACEGRGLGSMEARRPYFLTIGSVEPRKNIPKLVAGFDRSGLALTHDLIVVGRMAWGDASAMSGVEYVGAVDDNRLRSLLRGCTALVSASLYEGFGLPIAEALYMGIHPVCSDIPAYREVAGEQARYFDPKDVDSIADALVRASQELPSSLIAEPCRWTRANTEIELLALYAKFGVVL